ncbi:MAG: acyltransferase [Deltaproteobacteria bacterium]|nr:acyltransferase [Deltaproteobacteria bacterium]MBK8240648.1 acyltransferase [Deltaproteobacteria bacterium]MBK8718077.1 acyltransferase [Deltaproteobacteria bacterium]MBP7288512.1 acyltransferase [Nannocystaceae bacterium]
MEPESIDPYREQHQRRLSWMPWLFHGLKPELAAWVRPWQVELQAELMRREAVTFGEDCFVAPEAAVFAEPRRGIVFGPRCTVAAFAFLHGPLTIGAGVSINARASLDGGAAGIVIGDGCRIATGATIYAFDHGLAVDRPIAEQAVTSHGITLGRDVWVGANAGITDGVRVGDGAVIGMGAIVTRDVPAFAIVAGSPARVIGERRRV